MIATEQFPTLPNGWRLERCVLGTVLIRADRPGVESFVTVNERLRGFAAGITAVKRSPRWSIYTGRGWKARLYDDAIAACMRISN